MWDVAGTSMYIWAAVRERFDLLLDTFWLGLRISAHFKLLGHPTAAELLTGCSERWEERYDSIIVQGIVHQN